MTSISTDNTTSSNATKVQETKEENIEEIMEKVRQERKKKNEDEYFLMNAASFLALALLSIGFGSLGFRYGMSQQVKKLDQDIDSPPLSSSQSSSPKSFSLKFKNMASPSPAQTIASNKADISSQSEKKFKLPDTNERPAFQKESIKFPSRNKPTNEVIFPKRQLASGLTPLQAANRALFLGTVLCMGTVFVGTGKLLIFLF